MDKITKENEKQWNKMVKSGVPCSRPKLNLNPQKAKEWLDKNNILGNLKGKKVLCLASGGGQQSVGFAILGAKVTVVDFSSGQLKKDKLVAEKLSLDIKTVKSDMRDLSKFRDNEFDVIYQPYSINYIQRINKLFDEVTRVLKREGVYHLMFHNPFVHGTWKDGCWGNQWKKNELWKGKGYPIWQPYKDGSKIKTNDPNWNYSDKNGKRVKMKSPQEFKHTLSSIINGLIKRGFNIVYLDEYTGNNFNAKPGTWDHYISCAPPWLFLWVRKQ